MFYAKCFMISFSFFDLYCTILHVLRKTLIYIFAGILLRIIVLYTWSLHLIHQCIYCIFYNLLFYVYITILCIYVYSFMFSRAIAHELMFFVYCTRLKIKFILSYLSSPATRAVSHVVPQSDRCRVIISDYGSVRTRLRYPLARFIV